MSENRNVTVPDGSSLTRDPTRARDQHVLEELAGAPAGAAVHVAPEPRLQPQPGALEDLREEVAPVVDDDQHGRAAAQRPPRVREHVATIPST